MYEERKDSFSVKGFIFQILIILLFVFLMLWLFPNKSYFDKKFNRLQSEQDIKQLEVLYGEIFANNVERMKDGAKGYFTDERLPQSIGQSIKMTLGEMYDKHLVLKMSAVDGKTCSTTESYVEIVKFENEYQMKVNLKCGDKEDYIIVYMGCYTYCKSGVCEKRVTQVDKGGKVTSTPTNPPSKKYCQIYKGKYYDGKGNIVSQSEYKKDCEPQQSKNYMYEYKLVTEGTTLCTGWTEWTKDKITPSDSIQVDTKSEIEKTGTKTESYISGYNTEKIKTGTKTERVKTGTKTEKVKTGTTYQKVKTGKTTTETYISGYKEEKVVVGTKDVKVGTTKKTTTTKVKTGTTKVYLKSGSGKTIPKNTSTYIYVKTGSTTKRPCSSCAQVTTYTWDVYKVVPVYKVVTKREEVPVYKVEKIYKTIKTPIYKTRTVDVYTVKEVPVYKVVETPIYTDKTVPVYTEKKTPIYKTREIPVYGNVIYYRSKTCSTVTGGTYYRWSTSKNDVNLINQGYKLTENVKEI